MEDIRRLVRTLALCGCLLCALAIVLLIAEPLLVQADVRPSITHTITNTDDSGPGSLRQALADADDGDVIAFSLSTPATITLTSGELVIEDDLAIEGPGAELLAISGGGLSRVINVTEPVSLTIDGLTIRDGYVLDENGGGMLLTPGCYLTLTASVLVTNTADRSPSDTFRRLAMGGGLYGTENTSVMVSDCKVIDNTGFLGGGLSIDGGDLTIVNSDITDNQTIGPIHQAGGAGLYGGSGASIFVSGGHIADNWNMGIGMFGHSMSLHMQNVRVERNYSPSTTGGAVFFMATSPGTELVIDACQFFENSSETWGGAVAAMSNGAQIRNCLFQGNTANDGGAMVVRFDSSATITNTEFISNTTSRYGGALLAEGLVTIDGCRFEGNHADQEGGAIDHPIGHVLTVSNTTFIRNNADISGGALRTRQAMGASLDGCVFEQNSAALGGAIFGQEIGRLSLSSCSLSSNHADQDGGALYVTQADRLTLTDTDVISNTANNGGGISGSAGQVVISGSLLQGNTASAQGGAINLQADLILTGTQVLSNTCGTLGGGAWVWGDTTIYDTRFETNQADSAWGALGIAEGRLLDVAYSQFVGNQAGDVGALFMSHGTLDSVLFAGNSATMSVGACSVGGPVTITNSSFVSNTSQTLGMLVNTYDLTMLNTTFAGNTSTGAGPGAIHAVGPMTLTHCTIANNASESGAGGVNSPLAGATLLSTIVANNTSTNGNADISGAFTSGGHNLIGIADGSSGFTHGENGDLVGSVASPIDPLLGSLDDTWGDTPTLPLLPGSPAIDAAGDDAPALDQRGLPRLGRADIGAFEARGFTLSALSGDGQRAPVFSVFTLPLVVGVTSAWGDPVDGGLVTFRAPMIGPSANLSAPVGRILGGQTSVLATANGLTGTYAVEALARGARPAGFVYRVAGVLEAPQARDVVVEPTVPLNPSVTPTITPAATPAPTLPPVMMEPLTFSLENVASEQRQGLWLPMVFK